MIISKHQAKQLRYLARANYSSSYSVKEASGGKVKHREFPCFELSYDESKADDGNVELTSVVVSGNLFDGEYEELLERLKSVGEPMENIRSSPKDITLDKTPSEELEYPVSDDMGIASDIGYSVTIGEVVDTPMEEFSEHSSMSLVMDSSSVESEEFSATLECNGAQVDILSEPVENAEPIETVESILEEPVKPFTKAELNDLRIKCATMRLAKMYGEREDSSIADIIGKYPDASVRLNQLYVEDKIKPYTISVESLKAAYSEEFKALSSM